MATALARAASVKSRAIKDARVAELAMEFDAYESSLGKNVPVLTPLGPGIVVSYHKQTRLYTVALDGDTSALRTYSHAQLTLDDASILSPRKEVETPFGMGEIVGLDPHAGCYAVTSEVATEQGDWNSGRMAAFVQISDVRIPKKRASSVEVVHHHPALKSRVPSVKKYLQKKMEVTMPDEIAIVSAKIVESRINKGKGKNYVQYKLEIVTDNYGTLSCWKRYSTFRSLCDLLVNEKGFKKQQLPDLPKKTIFGYYSDAKIKEREVKLNDFLTCAVEFDHLQWGIRVSDTISVYKRRVKKKSFFQRMSTYKSSK